MLWLFLLPHAWGVLYFSLLPMAQVLIRSFHSAVGGRWMGLHNYLTVLQNTAFRLAVSNTLRFTAVCIPVLVLVSLILAVALHTASGFGSAVRTALLMPMAVPAASVVLVWKALFHLHFDVFYTRICQIREFPSGTVTLLDCLTVFICLVVFAYVNVPCIIE